MNISMSKNTEAIDKTKVS